MICDYHRYLQGGLVDLQTCVFEQKTVVPDTIQ